MLFIFIKQLIQPPDRILRVRVQFACTEQTPCYVFLPHRHVDVQPFLTAGEPVLGRHFRAERFSVKQLNQHFVAEVVQVFPITGEYPVHLSHALESFAHPVDGVF
jgi:hypothetical protein